LFALQEKQTNRNNLLQIYNYQNLTVDTGKSTKKKIVNTINIIHRNAMSKPGELYIVTFIPKNVKFICFNRIVKHGPRRRPICRQAKQEENDSIKIRVLFTENFR